MTSITAASSKTTSTTDSNHTPGIKLTDKARAKKASTTNTVSAAGVMLALNA